MSDAPAKPAKRGGMLILVVVGLCSLGAGAAVPYVMGKVSGGSGGGEEATDAQAASSSSGHGTTPAHGAPAAGDHGGGGHGDAHGGGHTTAPKTRSGKRLPVAIPFGEAIVNLSDARATRYLRVKILLAVDENRSSEVEDLVTRQKPFLKSWLIGYLADQSLKDVERSGVNRVRREVRDRFNEMLYPDGEERILDVLFDEYVVQ
ncbi:MAG TPA: flagellar basal body-associated FliL family protein [Gemmataceae bacterium]|jgi:flagellar basal body-associated protein FliL|nr:flagellar basal body-associated FliL family protein [Gemmataceae bacterium]